jgi:hypothetical protein
MRTCLLLLIIVLVTSCSRDEVNNESSNLLGKWKLTAYYISPGGETTWQDADPNERAFVTFTPSCKMIFLRDQQETRFDYTIIEDGLLSSTGNNITVSYGYIIKGNTLELTGGGCIERCSTRYVRIGGPFE